MKRNEKCDDATTSLLTSLLKPTTVSLQRLLPPFPPPFPHSSLQKCSSQTNHSTRLNSTRLDSNRLIFGSSFHPRLEPEVKHTNAKVAVVVVAVVAAAVAVAASASAALRAAGYQQQVQVDLQAAAASQSQSRLRRRRSLCSVGWQVLCLSTDVASRHCCNQNGVYKLKAYIPRI